MTAEELLALTSAAVCHSNVCSAAEKDSVGEYTVQQGVSEPLLNATTQHTSIGHASFQHIAAAPSRSSVPLLGNKYTEGAHE